MDASSKCLIVIVGPTAVGKTAVALEVARHFGTEVVSADSRQVFRELEIGTAKPSADEQAAVPHHFVDSRSIAEGYDAAQFGADARDVINQLFQRHDKVVLVGGSGLYVYAVIEGFDDIPAIDPQIRSELVREWEEQGLSALQEKLRMLDPELYHRIDRNNPHRMIRALEVVVGTGESIESFRKQRKKNNPFNVVKIGLTLPREELYQRIDDRMDAMISRGLFDEAKKLYGFRDHQALQTVGYQEIFGYIEGRYDEQEAIRLLKRNSRRYAKRQLTWFKRDTEIVWLNPANITEIIAVASGSLSP